MELEYEPASAKQDASENKIQESPENVQPIESSGTETLQDLEKVSQNILDLVTGISSFESTFGAFFANLNDQQQTEGAPYVKSALQKAQGVPRVINPMTDAVRAQIMKRWCKKSCVN